MKLVSPVVNRWQRVPTMQVKADMLGAKCIAIQALLMLLYLLGCAPQAHMLGSGDRPLTSTPQISSDEAIFTADRHQTTDFERLVSLWRKRVSQPLTFDYSKGDYPLGPGDVLEVSVPAMEELQSRVVRVSGEGAIALPLIGTVQAAGLTERQLREAIHRRLEKYMRTPHLNLFVREYRSRQVAVIGAVAKPGLYNLASEADTILDMVALAGGMTKDAAARILLLPAEAAEPAQARALSTALPAQLVSQDPSLLSLKKADPIMIDLKQFSRGGPQSHLPLPVRPGDIIMVPDSGQVLVEGWVGKPGSYQITPGLTVLGAVAAAGGPLFAADPNTVRVVRNGRDGGKILFTADLEKIKRGEQLDVSVQEGDVVEVTSSTPKLFPYGVYRFFSSIFHIGAGIPLF
jgi:polysaccharide biosynthesis/export protein